MQLMRVCACLRVTRIRSWISLRVPARDSDQISDQSARACACLGSDLGSVCACLRVRLFPSYPQKLRSHTLGILDQIPVTRAGCPGLGNADLMSSVITRITTVQTSLTWAISLQGTRRNISVCGAADPPKPASPPAHTLRLFYCKGARLRQRPRTVSGLLRPAAQ